MSEEHDINNLRAAFEEAKQSRPPKDPVPRELKADDAKPLPAGPDHTVAVTEYTEDGITHTSGSAFVTRPIMSRHDLNRKDDSNE